MDECKRIFLQHIALWGADEPITYDNGKAKLLESLKNAYIKGRVKVPVGLEQGATLKQIRGFTGPLSQSVRGVTQSKKTNSSRGYNTRDNGAIGMVSALL